MEGKKPNKLALACIQMAPGPSWEAFLCKEALSPVPHLGCPLTCRDLSPPPRGTSVWGRGSAQGRGPQPEWLVYALLFTPRPPVEAEHLKASWGWAHNGQWEGGARMAQ